MGEKNEVTTIDQSDNLTVMAKCVSEQDWQKCESDCPREETHVCYGLFAPLVPTTSVSNFSQYLASHQITCSLHPVILIPG